ncbi:MAG TPA: hypothetical protein VFX79_01195 [Candidatus Saccharimonadales bacterium]|nr:hypothetical protein [Candidatus Saccharimonadales bacterium]
MKGARLIISVLVISVLSASTLFVFDDQHTSALSGSQFRANRIIDDSLFYRSADMSPSQIQNFLNSKVPSCDTNHAETSSPNDSGPPYTCLKNFKQNTPSRTDGLGLCNPLGARSNRSAAAIIYDVSRVCGVSAKVIIVTLQKEQSLITDTWPWDIQYRSAMGYGCPDTAPCDSEYYGFFNQVYNAARQFKRYKSFPGNYNYRAGFTSFIQWHPNAGCGGSNVKLSNHATAGLYNYTPYRPNQAALNNLYGEGNSCSSYGNRNFWRLYNDWFGGTLTNLGPDRHQIGDWDGDGQDEVGLLRHDEHFLNYNHSGPAEEDFIYGSSRDGFLVGDWDGDGNDEIGLKEGNTYSFNYDNDTDSEVRFSFGRNTDHAFVGDWDGDGADEIGLRRGQTYFLDYDSSSGPEATFGFGRETDMSFAGDWNRDGKDDIGLRRGQKYFFSFTNSSGADRSFSFGRETDTLIVGDWDGDDRDEVSLRRGQTYFLNYGLTSGANVAFSFGRETDTLIVGDWDDDGTDEIGLRRNSTYFLDYDHVSGPEVTYTFGR